MMELIFISPLQKLFTHFRFLLTLRSQEGKYHSLILFRLTPSRAHPCIDDPRETPEIDEESILDPKSRAAIQQLYVMESACPHLGAEMTHADIEEYEDTVVAVCPWHRYDFDLKTGKSETGLRTCTYPVEVRVEDRVEKVYIEGPSDGTGWRVVELRPVSEEFADPPSHQISKDTSEQQENDEETVLRENEPIIPLVDPPKTLMEWAVLILNTPNPVLKVERTKHAVHAFRTGKLTSIGNKSSKAPRPPDVPPREEDFKKNIVNPGKVKKRRNRAAMLHALANIEQWAIDLAWDIIARFGPMHKDLPAAFFSDFTKMALDESKHFSLLVSRLASLDTPYGSLPTHASLWESATATSQSFRARLAIIHLVHEARGLDVNPTTIDKFRKAGDKESVKAMEIIHADEVTHVTAGHRWFCWACEKGYGGGIEPGAAVEPVKTFREEVKRCWRGEIKGPFNVADREKAGLAPDFYEDLRGDMELELELPEVTEAEIPVAYETK